MDLLLAVAAAQPERATAPALAKACGLNGLEAGVTGAELLWGFARADVPDTTFATVRVFQAYFASLYPLYEQRHAA